MPTSPEDSGPSPIHRTYATLADAAAGVAALVAAGNIPKAVRCGADGVLAVTDSQGGANSQPFLAGEKLPMIIKSIVVASCTGTCVPVSVFC